MTPADPDADRDGAPASQDCDDADAGVWPDAPESCDGVDTGIHPDAPELCDGVDQDCDGAVDDEPSDGDTWYADADHDGYGDGLGDDSACDPGATNVLNSADDDDSSPLGPADPCPPYSGIIATGLGWTLDEGDATYTFTQDPVVSEAGGLSVTDHKVGAGSSGGCDYSSETTRVWRCDADGLWLLSTRSETTLSSCGASDGTKTSETVFDGDGLLTLPAGLTLYDSWEGYATAGGSTWYYTAWLEYYGELYADPMGRGDELYELAWVWTEELHPLEGMWLHRTLGAFEAEASYEW